MIRSFSGNFVLLKPVENFSFQSAVHISDSTTGVLVCGRSIVILILFEGGLLCVEN